MTDQQSYFESFRADTFLTEEGDSGWLLLNAGGEDEISIQCHCCDVTQLKLNSILEAFAHRWNSYSINQQMVAKINALHSEISQLKEENKRLKNSEVYYLNALAEGKAEECDTDIKQARISAIEKCAEIANRHLKKYEEEADNDTLPATSRNHGKLKMVAVQTVQKEISRLIEAV